jgi:biopolymer transport protein ExbD
MRRRSWQRHGPTGHVELNVIPLIDVVFFLLVFYVISTSFAQESAVQIDRPASASAAAVTHGFVPVAILKSGAVQLGSQVTSLAQLPGALSAALAQAGSDHVLVLADREATTGLLLQVMDACRAGGAANVDVAASPAGQR